MLFLMLWFYLVFLCCNHRIYRAYAKITWHTLYQDMKPVEWRDYKMNQALRHHTVPA